MFDIAQSGAGLGNAVADAVQVLASHVALDVQARAADDPSDAVDAVAAFVDRISANDAAAAPCALGLIAVDMTGDGVSDTFEGVQPGTTVCFDVVPKTNTTVEPKLTPQMFRASVVVQGDRVATLDTRTICFLVPPEIPVDTVD